jgi:hypothetical protein
MVFKGQTITLALDTDVDLTGFDGFILYKKPNGIQGEWEGTIIEDTVTYDIQENDIDVAGVWRVQAKAVDGSDVKFGKITVIEFRTHL